MYYNQWQYSLTFCLPEVSCLRELDHELIDQALEGRRKWREIVQQRWQRNRTVLANTHQRQEITDKTVNDLHVLATVLLDSSIKFKSVVSINTMWIYTNDLELLKQLVELPCINAKYFTQALVKNPKNTIVLKNPQHTHRTYFRMKKLTQHEKQILSNFLQNHLEHVRLSPSLTRWLLDKFLRLQDYFFVDHTGISWLTMLSLVHPGLTRKTMQIEQAK